ncbi:MAG: transposase [Patescibacteria group bacterium]
MPRRHVPLIDGEFYHVYNRGVEKRPIFSDRRSYQRFIATINYYRFIHQPMRLSNFFKLSVEKRSSLIDLQNRSPSHITISCFVLMENHFHLLLQQEPKGDISVFLRNLCDSYTRYFNTRDHRVGPLFQGQFKAVRIESDDQLIHVSRYIHLNPYSSGLVKTLDELIQYAWSSLPLYMHPPDNSSICNTSPILNAFKTRDSYWKFIADQADYQRKLDNIKHLLVENPEVRS